MKENKKEKVLRMAVLRTSLQWGVNSILKECQRLKKERREVIKQKKVLIQKILYEAEVEEIPKLKKELQNLNKKLENLTLAEPYRARLQKYRKRIRYLDEVITKDLQGMNLEVKPICLEEADRLLQAIKSDLKSEEEVESENGGGTGNA